MSTSRTHDLKYGRAAKACQDHLCLLSLFLPITYSSSRHFAKGSLHTMHAPHIIALFSVTLIAISLAVLSVILRFHARKVKRLPLMWDDWLILCVLVCDFPPQTIKILFGLIWLLPHHAIGLQQSLTSSKDCSHYSFSHNLLGCLARSCWNSFAGSAS